ncbi:MAG TPA: MFS transporter [Acidimicrobiales bacterium]|nr:MFS transporter [Acidimicrobiales bacterium]
MGRIQGGDGLWSRDLLGISASTVVSGLGDGVALVGLPLLAASLDRNPVIVALVMVAQRAPWLFSVVTGAVADRVRLRPYVSVVEVARMVLVVLLGVAVVTHFHPLAAVFVVAAGLGSFESAFFAATGRMVTAVVELNQLGRANGYLFALQVGSEQVAGQALGGLLAAVALSLPFIFDGATFGLSAVLLVTTALRRDDLESGPNNEDFLAGIRLGLEWFAKNPGLRTASVYVAILAFCQSLVVGVMVLWSLHVLHLSRSGFGLLMGATTAGMVVGALTSGRAVDRLGTGPMLVFSGAVAAIAYLVAGSTSMAIVAGAALFIEQSAVAAGSVANQAMRQMVIPRDMLGRVANVTRSLIYGAIPAGALVGGLVASRYGLRLPFFVAGGLQLALVALLGPRMVRLLAAEQPA